LPTSYKVAALAKFPKGSYQKMPHLVDSALPSTAKGSIPLLQTYAKDITSAAEIISTYCTSEGLTQPSFDPLAPSVTLKSTTPLDVQDARQKLIASAAAIQKLATEPADYLPNLAVHVRSTLSFLIFKREGSFHVQI
jgi:hypothetical protein